MLLMNADNILQYFNCHVILLQKNRTDCCGAHVASEQFPLRHVAGSNLAGIRSLFNFDTILSNGVLLVLARSAAGPLEFWEAYDIYHIEIINIYSW